MKTECVRSWLMVTFISNSPAETESLGHDWGRSATTGLVIGLTGDLGAGKTQLVRGLATGLEIAQRVHSPTFALVNEYSGGRLPLAHLDLYRLEARGQILGAGLVEYFINPPGVVVVEWAERWFTEPGEFPAKYRRVMIESAGETTRRIMYEDLGA